MMATEKLMKQLKWR